MDQSAECGARWLESTEVFCQREAGHEGSTCWSKYRIEYENGIVSKGQVWWASRENLESQRGKYGHDEDRKISESEDR
jgi:hypothetical protein